MITSFELDQQAVDRIAAYYDDCIDQGMSPREAREYTWQWFGIPSKQLSALLRTRRQSSRPCTVWGSMSTPQIT